MSARDRPHRPGLRLVVPDGFDAPMVLPAQSASAIPSTVSNRRRRDPSPRVPAADHSILPKEESKPCEPMPE
jgi:hypothetical protein